MLESPPAIIPNNNGRPCSGVTAVEGATAPRPASVSVVIPCLNEERFIGAVLENLAGQYDAGAYEIIVVDGLSTDKTRAKIAEFMDAHPGVDVRVVDNPQRHIPAGVNLGITAARGEIIVRMDAHSIPSENYVRRCVELLNAANVAVVGMPWRTSASAPTPIARAIALAVTHPFGIGDAKYRAPDAKAPQLVDTVPFGVFRKELWREVGGFNEQLLANEDYDFHYRIRARGGRILLDTSGHSLYFARPTLKQLARQYFRYGTWKAQMLKLHPRSLRPRQVVAPAFVAGVASTALLGFWWHPMWLALLLAVVPYTLLSLFCAFQLARRGRDLSLLPFIAIIFPVLHIAWGSSFWLGLIRAPHHKGEIRHQEEIRDETE